MASAPPRNRFARSTLIRLLSDLAAADVAESPLTVAERLGPWLDWTDAIALSTALQAPTSAAKVAPALAAKAARAAADELARVRSTLSRAITSDEALCAPDAPGAAEGSGEVKAPPDFTPYRLSCGLHQRAMTAAIGPLRQRVRAALAAASPALARLAAMDEVLDAAMTQRERHALGRVPALLERHARLRGQPGQVQVDWVEGTTGQAAEPAPLGATVQRVLLAELDIRLKPIEGMMDALKQAHAATTGINTTAAGLPAGTPAASSAPGAAR